MSLLPKRLPWLAVLGLSDSKEGDGGTPRGLPDHTQPANPPADDSVLETNGAHEIH